MRSKHDGNVHSMLTEGKGSEGRVNHYKKLMSTVNDVAATNKTKWINAVVECYDNHIITWYAWLG